jgi:hypothetical protein
MNGFESSESSRNVRVLDQVRVANPCPMSWDKMVGDDKVRFCSECQRRVWNFFEMTDAEIVEVLRANPERLCAQITKTRDGTTVTKDHRPTQTQIRFSMLAMMIFATCLSPMVFFAPGLYRWLVPGKGSIPPKMQTNVMGRTGGVVVMPFDDYLVEPGSSDPE